MNSTNFIYIMFSLENRQSRVSSKDVKHVEHFHMKETDITVQMGSGNNGQGTL